SSPQGIKKIIVNEDVKILVKAQGIGAKTAKRILLELKDKFNIENDNNDIEGFEDVEREIIEALMSLGYSESESKKASKNVDKNVRIEDAIKASLKYLMK
ncbi:MAG: helix-hairpin-helix domain-containing protein, partial [Clostridiaceae bacterium]